jgi:hypothetical protein
MKRREFLKSAARVGIFTALGAGVVWGFRTKKISPEAKAACPVNPSCTNCGEYAGCKREIKQDRKTSV